MHREREKWQFNSVPDQDKGKIKNSNTVSKPLNPITIQNLPFWMILLKNLNFIVIWCA